MTFEEWFNEKVPAHRRRAVEKSDWVKVWMQEAFEAAKGDAAPFSETAGENVLDDWRRLNDTKQSDHKKRHKALHEALDELCADFLVHNRERTLTGTSLMELIEWSYTQTFHPTERN